LNTVGRADRFYDEQVLDRLNLRMKEFVARQEMFFLATADGHGECDSTFRAGPPGFLHVLDDATLAYPEYRGNGVMASLGNIRENPHIGMLMIDFSRDRIGLHVNGRARLVTDETMRQRYPDLPVDPVPGRRPQMWVEVEVEEAYIHCSKHIPRLVRAPLRQNANGEGSAAADGEQTWGTDDVKRKGGDYFEAGARKHGLATR
jgi:predicted pyridoxine 5'-phosphate oxidase superfamily flavin-nucleotide-binding protein